MTLKLNFENYKKLVPTQIPTQTFEFKLGMQGLKDPVSLHDRKPFAMSA